MAYPRRSTRGSGVLDFSFNTKKARAGSPASRRVKQQILSHRRARGAATASSKPAETKAEQEDPFSLSPDPVDSGADLSAWLGGLSPPPAPRPTWQPLSAQLAPPQPQPQQQRLAAAAAAPPLHLDGSTSSLRAMLRAHTEEMARPLPASSSLGIVMQINARNASLAEENAALTSAAAEAAVELEAARAEITALRASRAVVARSTTDAEQTRKLAQVLRRKQSRTQRRTQSGVFARWLRSTQGSAVGAARDELSEMRAEFDELARDRSAWKLELDEQKQLAAVESGLLDAAQGTAETLRAALAEERARREAAELRARLSGDQRERAARDEMAAKLDALKTRMNATFATLRAEKDSAVAAARREHAAPRRGEAAPAADAQLLAQNADLRAMVRDLEAKNGEALAALQSVQRRFIALVQQARASERV